MGKGFVGALQTTLKSEIILNGIGVHSGAPVSIILHPAEADTGIRFVITKGDEIVTDIPADYKAISNVTLCTILSNSTGSVATVEHLMAALRGLSIDNVVIEIDSNEVPIMDGSSAPFVEAIDEVGIYELDTPRRFLKVLKTVRIEENGCWAEISPYNGFHLDVEIDFEAEMIGNQRYQMDMNPGAFRRELSRARTFGFMSDVEKLWAAGRALGSSLENTVALGEDRIINPEGLRFENEFVRHKALDAVGDLALAGSPILGAYKSYKGGHRINSLIVKALFADQDAWSYVEAPRVRETGHAEIALAAANFAAHRS
ncbi:MAG: UDP-3-O-acyl-N-acetylglucosamine deacetylase [Methyloligellaceae bacterium]